jgi:hypothetical protein
VRQLPGVLLL